MASSQTRRSSRIIRRPSAKAMMCLNHKTSINYHYSNNYANAVHDATSMAISKIWSNMRMANAQQNIMNIPNVYVSEWDNILSKYSQGVTHRDLIYETRVLQTLKELVTKYG